jgi:C1A family cysteine protease
MKKLAFLLKVAACLLMFIPGIIKAQTGQTLQKQRLSSTYQLRERKASPALLKTLASQRSFIAEKKLNFLVANTAVSEKKLSDIAGTKPVPPQEATRLQEFFKAHPVSAELLKLHQRFPIPQCAAYKSYDARNNHLIPAIRNQRCGDCWAYSAIGVLECSYVKVNGLSNPLTVDLSEKQMVDCAGAGDCGGGWPYKTLDFLKNTHTRVMNEANDPDNGVNGTCPPIPASAHVQGLTWGVVDANNNLNTIAPVNRIKEAICTYGSVSACILATPLFQNFGGHSVFNETPSNPNSPSINHAIVIIGWDDSKNAWLVRNSWSTLWGDQGYAWVNYNTNNIGYGAVWCIAKQNTFRRFPVTKVIAAK